VSAPATQRVAWYWLDTRIPATWECTYYRPFHRQGQLQFHDRAGLRAIFTWRRESKVPDVRATIAAQHRQAVETLDGEDAAARDPGVQVSEWGGYTCGSGSDRHGVFAAAWLEHQQMLIAWQFAPGVVAGEYQAILERAGFNDGPVRIWRLFGLRADLPAAFEVEEGAPLPANTMLHFIDEHRRQVTLRRWGLPETVKAGRTLFGFYASFLKALGRKVREREDIRFINRDAVRLQTLQRGEYAMEKVVGRWWPGEGIVWEQPEERRIYAIEQTGPVRSQPLDLHDVVPPEA
jgi:hypothetical protein